MFPLCFGLATADVANDGVFQPYLFSAYALAFVSFRVSSCHRFPRLPSFSSERQLPAFLRSSS